MFKKKARRKPQLSSFLLRVFANVTMCLLLGFATVGARTSVAQNELSGEVTIEQATELVKADYKGEILNAEQVEHKGQIVFKIKVLLANGRVKSLLVSPADGSIIRSKKK